MIFATAKFNHQEISEWCSYFWRLTLKRPFHQLLLWAPEGLLVSPALWSVCIVSAALCRGPCVVSMECKHPTLTRSSDDQGDHGTTVFDRLLFFNMFKNSSRTLFFEAIQDDNRADQKQESSGTIGLGKTILGEITALWVYLGGLTIHFINTQLKKRQEIPFDVSTLP